MLKGIAFDLDGTLVDSLGITFDAFNQGITRLGGKHHTPAEITRYFGTGERQIFAQILGADKAEGAYQVYRTYLDSNLYLIQLHEGVRDLLERVQSLGIPISI